MVTSYQLNIYIAYRSPVIDSDKENTISQTGDLVGNMNDHNYPPNGTHNELYFLYSRT